MNRCRKLAMTPFMVVVAIAAGQAGDAAAALPKDACALPQARRYPGARAGRQDRQREAGYRCQHGFDCRWVHVFLGAEEPSMGESAVTLTVMDTSKAFPGHGSETLKQGMLAKVKAGGPNAAQVTGVGDAAVFTHEARSFNGMVEALLAAKGILLSVRYHGGDALASKDKLVALAKEAAARL
jgi:hypothetical protein